MIRPTILFLLVTPLLAQWSNYPSKRIPMKDGKPDLTAAAPRTAWDAPDFSGVWDNVRVRPPAGNGIPPPVNGPAPAPPPPPASGPPVATFANIAAGMKGGAPLQPWAAELIKQRRASNSKDNPDALCLPMGLMQFNTHSQPRKIIQTPDMIVIIYEPNSGLRQIYLDGRTLPGPEADAWWYGYSVGHWDGNELVVETVRMKDLQWLDIWGTPLTEDGEIIERFRRTNFGTLEIDVTIDDARAYTEPWTVRVNQRLLPNEELIEFICAENDQFTNYLTKAAVKP
ncbi:MAG: hypothetical protein ABI811_08795 [Acidobacteriota bacterium]